MEVVSNESREWIDCEEVSEDENGVRFDEEEEEEEGGDNFFLSEVTAKCKGKEIREYN